jgi:sulfoquinovosyltransferase
MKLVNILSVAVLSVACGHAFVVSSFEGARILSLETASKAVTTRSFGSSSLQMNAMSDSAPPLNRNPPRKICLLVEPTPFTHVSGYANRFKEMLKFMAKAGDEVEILTVDTHTPVKDLPKKFLNFNIKHTQGFTFPLYNSISLSLDLPDMKGAEILERLKPDLIHVTSP